MEFRMRMNEINTRETKHRRAEIVAKRGCISETYFLSYVMLFRSEWE
jgi:hypothetical protein